MPDTSFSEGHVELDGLSLRYLEGGAGPALLSLCRTGELRTGPAEELLAERMRMLQLEAPSAKDRPPGIDLATTIARVTTVARIERFNVLGSAADATLALSVALEQPALVEALVLVSPETPPPDLECRLPEVTTPTLLLLGTRESVTAEEAARIYCEALPNCHLVLVYDARRDIAADRPEAFASVVTDFLQHRESFIVTRTSGLLHP